MKWLSSFLDWIADPPRMAPSTAIVTGVEKIERVQQAAYPPRHQDPGGAFMSKPKPRTDLGLIAVPAGQAHITAKVPTSAQIEIRFQLPNGDWTPWRVLVDTVRNQVPAIGWECRVKGSGAHDR